MRAVLSVWLVPVLSLGTALADTPKDTEKPRPTPPVRIERALTRVTFQNDGTAEIVTEARYRALTDAGRQGIGQAYVMFASRSEEASVEYLRTIKPDGTILEADGAAMDVTPPPTAQAPQFSDLQAKVRLARSVNVGDAVEVRLVRKIVRPLRPGEFWFNYFPTIGVPIDAEDVVLDVPADRPLVIRWDVAHPPKERTQDGHKTYSWSLGKSDVDPKELPPRKPLVIASTMTPEKLGAWYLELQADRSEITAEVRAKAEALTAGAATPLQKLEAIYDFVSTSVRYVSLSFGIGGYQPHPPAEVLRNQFGDCKDKDLLLRTLLAAVGIPAQSAIVHSSLGMPEPEVGDPSQFDHVMTVVTVDGQPFWLDASSGIAPFGVLDPSSRGRKALLVAASGSRAVEIPVRSPVPDNGTLAMTGKVDASGKLSVDSTLSLRGLSEIWLRALLRNQPAEPTGPFGQFWALITGGFGARMEKIDTSDPASIVTPLSVRYTVGAPWLEVAEMKAEPKVPSGLISMRAVSWAGEGFAKAEAPEPIRLGDVGEIVESLRLEFDPSLAFSLPASVKVERPFGSYESAYAVEGRTLTVRRSLKIVEQQVPAARKDEVIAFRDVISGDLDQRIVVRRTSKPDLRKLAATLDADALDSAGERALDDDDDALAVELLKLAVEKDPKHESAWGNLGRAQFAAGDLDGAERSFAKHLEVSPSDAATRTNLGRVAWRRNDLSKAEAIFRKQIEANPLDAWANTNLGALLASQEKWADAVPFLARAEQLQPGDVGDQMTLVTALARAGRRDEAMERSKAALEANPDPSERLLVAHVLVEEELDLERGDAEAAAVMRQAASKCRGVSLDSVPEDYWDSVAMVAAGYEVRGAAAFLKGDVDRAVTTLGTGYEIAPWGTTALWLARAYARQGDPAKGFRYYAHAVRNSRVIVPEELSEYTKNEFKGDMAAMSAKVHELSREAMMLDRVYPASGTFELPEAAPGDAGVSFEIKVLVDETGAVEDVRALGGKEPFLAAALRDVRRIRFRPFGLPQAPIKSVRIVEFFYLPTKEIRAFARFAPPPDEKALREFFPDAAGTP